MFNAFPAVIFLSGALLWLPGCLKLAGDGADAGLGGSETAQVAAASYAVGDYAEAARLYERVAQDEPGSVAALIGLGRAYGALGQSARAQSALARAQELSPRNISVLNELGRLALSDGDGARALAQFEAALDRDRRNLGALTGRAVTLDYLSRHAEAQSVYADALAIYPTNFVLMSNKALSQALSGDSAAAIPLMEELRRDPVQGAQVLPNLALAHVLNGQPGQARALLKGQLSAARIEDVLRRGEAARRATAAGQPAGHLIFQ